jgi:hypothetical protein
MKNIVKNLKQSRRFLNRPNASPDPVDAPAQTYALTLARERKIRDLGYNLVVIWEHEFISSLGSRQDRIALYTS